MKTITLTFSARALIDIYRVQAKLRDMRELLEDTANPPSHAELASLLDVAHKRITGVTYAFTEAQAALPDPPKPATASVAPLRHSSLANRPSSLI